MCPSLGCIPKSTLFATEEGRRWPLSCTRITKRRPDGRTHDAGAQEHPRGSPHWQREVLYRLQAGGGAPRRGNRLARPQRVHLPLPEGELPGGGGDVETLSGIAFLNYAKLT